MSFIIALLIAVIIGIIVKVVLSFFDVTKPYADILGFLVAVLYFLTRVL